MINLYDYQEKLKNGVYASWNAGNRNVIAVLPTGGGKTNTFAKIFAELNVPSVAIAHRQELVGQISQALARAGVVHRIIAPKKVIQFIITQHIKEFGRSFYHQNSPVAVAGIDTLIRRTDDLIQWINSVKLWTMDEAHHVLKGNKWGKGADLFTNAMGLGVTATPVRCDRKSLGRSKSGLFDDMVIGPTMHQLIAMKRLTPYKIFAPQQSIDLAEVEISKATGEFNHDQMVKAAHKSSIVGDMVDTYLKLTPGKRGISFLVDVAQAQETADAYNHKGVPAACISANSTDQYRQACTERFIRGELLQLTNVDLFGEGYDVPAVEVVSGGRPSQSYGLVSQHFGRMLRVSPGKTHGTYLDHVGNIARHRLTFVERQWSLDDEERGKKSKAAEDAIPIRACTECFQPYRATEPACPFCGFKPVPAGRSLPEQVDGDLVEFSPELYDRLMKEATQAVSSWGKPNVYSAAEHVMRKNMEERAVAQQELRDSIALWAGMKRDVEGRTDSQSYREFYYKFGVDVLTAQTLGRPDAVKLTQLIREEFI